MLTAARVLYAHSGQRMPCFEGKVGSDKKLGLLAEEGRMNVKECKSQLSNLWTPGPPVLGPCCSGRSFDFLIWVKFRTHEVDEKAWALSWRLVGSWANSKFLLLSSADTPGGEVWYEQQFCNVVLIHGGKYGCKCFPALAGVQMIFLSQQVLGDSSEAPILASNHPQTSKVLCLFFPSNPCPQMKVATIKWMTLSSRSLAVALLPGWPIRKTWAIWFGDYYKAEGSDFCSLFLGKKQIKQYCCFSWGFRSFERGLTTVRPTFFFSHKDWVDFN